MNKIFRNIKPVIITLFVVGLFIFFSWLSHRYAAELSASDFSHNFSGKLMYLLASIISVVIAGLSSSPLIPLAAAVWGPLMTVLLTASGWTIGAMIAFWLSRRFGEKLACRFINKFDIDDYRHHIRRQDLFWQLLIARIFLPVDIISYAIGLFTKMSWLPFFSATLIGSTLFTLIAVYISEMSVKFQIVFSLLFLALFFFRAQKSIKSIFTK